MLEGAGGEDNGADFGSLEAEREEEVDDGGGKALLDQGEDFWAVGVLFEDFQVGLEGCCGHGGRLCYSLPGNIWQTVAKIL